MLTYKKNLNKLKEKLKSLHVSFLTTRDEAGIQQFKKLQEACKYTRLKDAPKRTMVNKINKKGLKIPRN